ncbi:response regulator [Pseudoroseicyclus tamaricis]|uniref:Response regulator n=1 Tax=Pseudoroseicyclus tamaricis TaxID=2705421 RepID=A0A6B2JI56_9RHOB|nr:response regulator [Pseudoroseicyclus tamaricis]NDV01031.1 response regulator [Pseudoroseicyclus tamaricis]
MTVAPASYPVSSAPPDAGAQQHASDAAEGEQPLNILLVEDDDGDAKAVRRAFAKAGIATPIVRARDGLEALEMLRTRSAELPPSPFLLLVDINMPRMSGHDLVAALRDDPRLCSLAVFMLTTSRDSRDLSRAAGNHVAGYILKQKAGRDFLDLVAALGSYWRVVEVPSVQ